MCIVCTSCSDSFEGLSCTSDCASEPLPYTNEALADITFRNVASGQYMSRSLPSALPLSDGEFIEVFETGYTGTPENESNVKQLFNKQLADSTGLIAGNIYITRYETYHKIVNLNESEFYDDETYKGCGLRKRPELQGGGISFNDRGYYSVFVGDNQVKLTTYLFHVISDVSGNKLDVYYPYHPSNIKWHYYLFN